MNLFWNGTYKKFIEFTFILKIIVSILKMKLDDEGVNGKII